MSEARVYERTVAFAWCAKCRWKGIYRDTEFDAQPDAEQHRCPVVPDKKRDKRLPLARENA